MLTWNRTYSRVKLTMEAQPEPGYRYEIISTGVPNPVNVHATTPYLPRKRAATVPTIELAMLCAEQLWRWAINNDAHPDNAGVTDQRRQAAQARLEDLMSGPKVHYIIEIPTTQMMTAQYSLAHAGLNIDMRPHFPDGEMDPETVVDENRIYEAVSAVNQDLASQHLAPLLKVPPLMYHVENPQQYLEMLQREYRWKQMSTPAGRRWEERGERWPDVAARYPALTKG